MPKRSNALDLMPSAVLAHLRELGENLAIARKRRREPLKAWAQRIGVSEPTLARMEKGDPSVSMGVYATAIWLMGRAAASPADPPASTPVPPAARLRCGSRNPPEVPGTGASPPRACFRCPLRHV